MRTAVLAQNPALLAQRDQVNGKAATQALSPAQKRHQEGNLCIMRGLAVTALGIGMEVTGSAILLLTDYTWTGATIAAVGLPVTAAGAFVTFTGYLYSGINIVHTVVGASANIAQEIVDIYGLKSR